MLPSHLAKLNWKTRSNFKLNMKKKSQSAKIVWHHESLGVWMVEQTIPTELYFNEFIANVLHDYMGIIIFDLQGLGGC